ncbi:MAG: HAD family hydrolase [Erysipelotrichaceae bacterium]|nr:HAD family hydrolase [Erysipelotrichaceae bacterium]
MNNKNYRFIMFDLDGTLLPMDVDVFTRTYFSILAGKVAPLGYEPKALVNAIWSGTEAMVNNDGSCLNEDAFWKKFNEINGRDCRKDEPVFRDFYANEFNQAEQVCGKIEGAGQIIEKLKENYRLILATNPLFPQVGTYNRIRWAGLDPEDFELVTTYENSTFCKPNLDYYREIMLKIGALPEECLMVGNDVTEDMCVTELGMDVFLLTECLINKDNADISIYPQGTLDDLIDYLGL